MIKIDSLYFEYEKESFQLSIPHLTLDQNCKTAIIGPSGSGKTTLLNLISGILIPEKGNISIENANINSLTDAQRRAFRIQTIGFIFQDFQLLDYLTVVDNILHPYRITTSLKLTRDIRLRATELAQKLHIDNKLNVKPEKLSQGEQQRVAICRALLPKPKLILADEATGNLDPENKTRILEYLFECINEQDATLVAVTHDHELLPNFDCIVDFQAFYQNKTA